MRRLATIAFAFVVAGSASIAGDQAIRESPTRAETMLAQALTRAKAEGKSVLVDFGASWCPPCNRLREFLHTPAIAKIFQTYYVMLEFSVWEDPEDIDRRHQNTEGADMLMRRWGGGKGIPFYAVLDDQGSPTTGGGYPGSNTSIREFRAMIDHGAPRMTAAERETLAEHLNERSNGLGSISGKVVDGSSKPVVAAHVALVQQSFQEGAWVAVPGRRADTDDAGRYLFADLRAGVYYVIVEPPAQPAGAPAPSDSLDLVVYPSGSRLSDTSRITLDRNVDLWTVDVTLPHVRATTIGGAVTGSNGAPIAHAVVSLTNLEWAPDVRTTSTTADGKFSIGALRPGRYMLWARAPASDGSSTAPEFAYRSIDVSPDTPVDNLRLTTTQGGTIRGQLTFNGPLMSSADRSALRVVAVAVNPPPGASRQRLQSHVTAGGQFEITGVFGERVIRIDNLPPGWTLTSVTTVGRDVIDRPVSLDDRAGRAVDFDVRLAGRGAELSGVASDSMGRPRRGGAVIVFAIDASRWSFPSRFVRMAPINAKGEFELRALPEGEYLMAAVESLPASWDAPESLERLRALGTRVSLSGTEHRVLVLR